jgi:integrase/recombinase XerD
MKTAEGITFVLRHYLRAAYDARIITCNLSSAVPKLHFPKQDIIPIVWDDNNISRLLAAVDRGSPMGKRDYAVLQIVIKLGLRDGDVRNLKFENIKWSSNRIEFIQAKTMQFQSLPLLPEVGNAIIDYLKNGRPESSLPQLFLKHKAPYDGFQKAGNIVTKYMKLAKIPIPLDRRHGIHSLRHSLANRLLNQEIPLDVIAGILGHITINSSKEYMHLDIANLRKCALEVGVAND